MRSETERLGGEKYVRLRTFRTDGTPVPTPVWVARECDELLVWTPRDSGKVKRIRAGGRVDVTACDAFGGNPAGPTVAGSARLLDAERTDRVRVLLRRKYGLVGALAVYGSMLRGGRARTIGVAIALDE